VGELLQLVDGAADRSQRVGLVRPRPENKRFTKISAAITQRQRTSGAGKPKLARLAGPTFR